MPDLVLQKEVEAAIERGGGRIFGDSFTAIRFRLNSLGVTASRRSITSALFNLVRQGKLTLSRPLITEHYHGYGCATRVYGYTYSLPL